MPRDLIDLIKRILQKPPSYIAERCLQEVARLSDRWLAPKRARRLTCQRVLDRLGYRGVDDAWESLLSRPYPFLSDVEISRLHAIAPGESARILQEAETAMAHQVDLLGSGPTNLGETIDWHTDFKTGLGWEPKYCHAIEYANLDRPSDVKSVWELSRLQWLIPVAQAFHLTGDERYACAARKVLEDWIDQNPYAGSVNWSCTMEVALRIFTFTWFVRVLGRSQAFAETEFREKMVRCLYLHAEFTERYIEKSDVNGNHYTADAAGLVVAGLFLGDSSVAAHWFEKGWHILSEEVQRQVFEDGVDFEASVPYHRLVMELFLLPAIYGLAHGRQLPKPWRSRLVAMGRFVSAYTRPDGTVPVWGDNDDARTLPMAGKGLNDHRYLLGLAGLGLGETDLAVQFWGPVAEIAWVFGTDAAAVLAGRPAPTRHSESFPMGGFYVLAARDDHVLIDCGPVGLAGRGGHGHNDMMSIEATLSGELLIVDPGCFQYTASPAERNAFRSTAYHNTPQIAGAEINRFIRADYLWSLHCDAEPEVRAWSAGSERSEIVMTHTGYDRLVPPVRPVRKVRLEHYEAALTVADTFEGGGHAVEIPYHFAPDVDVALLVEERKAYLRPRGGGEFLLEWDAVGVWSVALAPARVAPSYGVVVNTTKLIWRSPDCMNASLSLCIRRCPE